MADKTFTLKPGEELDIFIRRRKESPSIGVRNVRRRGLITRQRIDDVLPRRLKTKDVQFYARIYDLGLLSNGDDIDFTINPNPPLVHAEGYSRTTVLEYKDEINDFFVDINPATWNAVFKEITDINEYGLSVSGMTDEYAAGKGYPISGGGGIGVSGSTAVRKFESYDGNFYKVTNNTDFDSEEVYFPIDASIEVYLFPTVYRFVGRADIWLQPRTYTFPQYDYWLNGFLATLPRSWFLYNDVWKTEFGDPAFASPTRPPITELGLQSLALRTAWKQLHTSVVKTPSLYKIRWNGAFGFRNYEADEVIDPTLFPTNETPDIIITPNDSPPSYRQYCLIEDGADLPAQLLVGAIKKGEEWFFIWNKNTTSNKRQGDYLIAT